MTTPFLRVEGLSKSFQKTPAVIDVSFSAAPSSFLCLVGPSGCGKTTLLRLIAGLETPDAGAILCEGEDLSPLPPGARRLGMVFQSYALFPNLSVAENVAYGLPRGVGRAERDDRVRTLLETVGLAGMADRAPASLSGGQQQRVAIARALAPRPRLLLLDEPLAALDPQIRETLRDELRRLQRELGVTTVMVTHDQGEAMALADQVVVLRAGRVEQAGAPGALYAMPATPFVAGFFGEGAVLAAEADGPFAARLGDGSVVGLAVAPPGRSFRLFVRPEAVRPAGPGERGVPATLVDRRFAGALARFTLRLATGERLLMDVPSAATAPAGPEGLEVVLDGARVLAFPPEGAA